jgi:hypothetical protein
VLALFGVYLRAGSSDNKDMKGRLPLFCVLLALGIAFNEATAASPSLSFDGRLVNASAKDTSFGQILEMFKQQTGLQYEGPPDFRSERLPQVEINGLSMRSALLTLFEGSNYDYILMAVPADPDKIAKVIVTGRSTKISSPTPFAASSAFPRRPVRQIAEDPFGGGGEEMVDDASINEGAVGNQPMENPAVPGVAPVQPGTPLQPGALLPGQVNPAQANPGQPYPPGMVPQQQPGQLLIQPQVLQPLPGNGNNPSNNPNDQRSPF